MPTRTQLAIAVGLLALTLAVFAQVREHDFVNFDDYIYVTRNPNSEGGLTAGNVAKAFDPYAAYWIPVTWLSLLVDRELYGDDATGFLLTNVALHVLNTWLLLWFLVRSTGSTWRAAIVAAVFAVHPLHVESVAWVTERKDVLSTCLMLVALHLWMRRLDAPRSTGRYLACAGVYAAALMAKPAVLTFPVLLLLLDVWPFARLRLDRFDAGAIARAVAEKLPLFALSVVAGLILLRTQAAMGGMEIAARVTPLDGVRHALEAYAAWLVDAVWPAGLAALYPVPLDTSWRAAGGGALLLAALTAVAWRAARRGVPAVAVGWVWFVLLALPASGIVPVGVQARADRFMYVPLIGLSIAVVWGGAALVRGRPATRAAAIAASVVALVALTVAAHRQTATWRDTETLFGRALAVTEGNHYAHNRLGELYKSRLEFDRAEPHYVAAVRLAPWFWSPQLELAKILEARGRVDEARPIRAAGERVRNGSSRPAETVGVGWMQAGRWADARPLLERAVAEDPRSIVARSALARVYRELGRTDDARDQLAAALEVDPDHPILMRNLAELLVTAPDGVADPVRALQLAERGLFIVRALETGLLESAAEAHAAAGRLEDARTAALRAAGLARGRGDTATATRLEARASGWGASPAGP